MCGLVGVMGLLTFREEQVFADLLMVDSIRGLDSTGVAVVNHDKQLNVLKGTVLPQVLLDSEEYKELVKKKLRAMLGHNRSATMGNISAKNAHPF